MTQKSPPPSMAQRIAETLPTLTRAHRKIADHVLVHPLKVATQPIDELATALEVSVATVNRFARALGFDGYPPFRAALVRDFENALAPVDKLRNQLETPATPADVFASSLNDIQRNIELTRNALDPASCERAVDAILKAQKIRIVGFGASSWLGVSGLPSTCSGKVLGQFEAFTTTREGRLLLVAPNIVTAERHLDVEPRDFRLWVCLHEETHRAQFGGVPWLGGHLIAEIHDYLALADSSAGEVLRRFRHGLGAIGAAVRGDPDASLVDAVQSPEQREVFDRITALMSLLEGHADHVMDEVGPDIVPTVSIIRERFDQRRNEPGAVDGLARRLLGLDAKMRQYSDGRAFVTHVISRVGLEGFNRVWTSPETLPSKDEILGAEVWCRRVAADLLPA